MNIRVLDAISVVISLFRGRTHGVPQSYPVLLMIILVGTMALLTWAALSEFDQVVSAEAKIIPQSKLQTVQHFEGGIIEKIHVRGGDSVAPGTPLISLSAIEAEGGFEGKKSELLSLSARLKRLQAEVTGTPVEFPAYLRAAVPDLLEGEIALMNARSQQLAASIGSLESQMRQRHGELEAAERSLQLIAQEREVITKLVERGLEPKLEAVRAEKTYAEAVARVTTLKAAIDELLERMKGARKESQAAALSELTKTMNEVVQIRKSLPVAANRVDRTVIRSPVEGVVNRVLASTIGGVIKAGEPVIEIVPADAKLVFEAKINPADIGFVKTGQSAMVKLSTYDFSIFGSLAGRVDLVSSDSVSNDKGETYYLVKVELIERRFKAVDKELALLPGMTAQIDIITGKRSVLTYLSAPITKTLSTAFREK